MQRIIVMVVNWVGNLILMILQGLWQGFLQVVSRLGHWVGYHVGRILPWVVVTAGVYGLFHYQPEIFGQLLVIGVMIWALWFMVSAPFRASRNKRRRRR